MQTKDVDWHDVVFRMYFIESGRNCPIIKNVTCHSITRWKTQRKMKFDKKLMDIRSQATSHVTSVDAGIE